MAFEKLSSADQEIVLRCMKATAAYIDDWEKPIRLGFQPEELQQFISEWPQIDDNGDRGLIAVNNCLNEVCNGFKIPVEEWSNWFDTPYEEVVGVYDRWLQLKGIRGGLR